MTHRFDEQQKHARLGDQHDAHDRQPVSRQDGKPPQLVLLPTCHASPCDQAFATGEQQKTPPELAQAPESNSPSGPSRGTRPTVGKTYYVSPDGAISNSGNHDAPWRSIEQASGVVQPGDTVIVKPGTYDAPHFGKGTIVGTAELPIVFMAAPEAAPGSVVIAGGKTSAEGNKGFSLSAGCDYVHIVGFTIRNTEKTGIFLNGTRGNQIWGNTIEGVVKGSGGILVEHGDDVLIAYNTVTGTTGTNTRGHGMNIANSSENIYVLSNHITNNEYTGIMIDGDLAEGGPGAVRNIMISGNDIFDNGQNGINADGLEDSEISNNVIRATKAGNARARNAIELYWRDSRGGSQNNRIMNNTIDQPEGNSIEIGEGEGNTGNVVFNNIIWGGISGKPNELIVGPNLTNPSPSPVVNREAGDYRLAPSGPGTETGVASFAGIAAPMDQNGKHHMGAFRHGTQAPKWNGPVKPRDLLRY